jgi:hypothetical protein
MPQRATSRKINLGDQKGPQKKAELHRIQIQLWNFALKMVSYRSASSRFVSFRLASPRFVSFRFVSHRFHFVSSLLVSFRSVPQETRRVSETKKTKSLMNPSSDDPPQTGGARKKTLLLNIAAFSPIKSRTIWSGTSRSGTSLWNFALKTGFVSFPIVPFRFVPIRLVPSRLASLRFASFRLRFISFRLVSFRSVPQETRRVPKQRKQKAS